MNSWEYYICSICSSRKILTQKEEEKRKKKKKNKKKEGREKKTEQIGDKRIEQQGKREPSLNNNPNWIKKKSKNLSQCAKCLLTIQLKKFFKFWNQENQLVF